MSFNIHPRTPTPEETVLEEVEPSEDRTTPIKEVQSETVTDQRVKWGKATVDTRFREELERQRYYGHQIDVMRKQDRKLARTGDLWNQRPLVQKPIYTIHFLTHRI